MDVEYIICGQNYRADTVRPSRASLVHEEVSIDHAFQNFTLSIEAKLKVLKYDHTRPENMLDLYLDLFSIKFPIRRSRINAPRAPPGPARLPDIVSHLILSATGKRTVPTAMTKTRKCALLVSTFSFLDELMLHVA